MVRKVLMTALTLFSLHAQTLSQSLYEITSSYYEQRTELVKAEALMTDLFQNGYSDPLRAAFSDAGLNLSIIDKKRGIVRLCALEESGEGVFYVRTFADAKTKDMLSIPHRFHDIRTGPIGIGLFQKSAYRAAAFNTAHRDVVDMAHTGQTLFELFHKVYARLYSHESIFQLHGFSAKNRQSESAASLQIIVSSASMTPSYKAEELVLKFAAQKWEAGLFPRDVNELGGTTNTTAKMLAETGYDGFIHIELESEFRKTLMSDKNVFRRFGGALR